MNLVNLVVLIILVNLVILFNLTNMLNLVILVNMVSKVVTVSVIFNIIDLFCANMCFKHFVLVFVSGWQKLAGFRRALNNPSELS